MLKTQLHQSDIQTGPLKEYQKPSLPYSGELISTTVRRNKLDIILNILETTREPIKKTHILYHAKINFYQLSRYLDLLLRAEMIEEIENPFEGYRTTEKGRIMLDLFSRI